MSDPARPPVMQPETDIGDTLERLQRDRKPGEIESGMMSGSDEALISATERFEGDLTEEEALEVLAPQGSD